MTDRADNRLGPAEELLSMTLHTRRVLGEIGYVRERSVAGPHFVPVGRRNFVTVGAGHLMLGDAVRKPRVASL